LSVLHNYFDGLTKLFSNLYLAKFLDFSAKLSFPYNQITRARVYVCVINVFFATR